MIIQCTRKPRVEKPQIEQQIPTKREIRIIKRDKVNEPVLELNTDSLVGTTSEAHLGYATIKPKAINFVTLRDNMRAVIKSKGDALRRLGQEIA